MTIIKPAFAFPHGFVIPIRKPSNSVRALVCRIAPKWRGTRLSVVYATLVHLRIGNGRPRVRLMRLSDGWIDDPAVVELSPREGARSAERRSRVMGVSGAIEPGRAVFVFEFSGRSSDLNTATPTLYLNALTDDPLVQEELNVARDAFQVGNPMEAIRIARSVIPLTAALYMTMLDHEAKYLDRTIASSVAVSSEEHAG